MKSCVTSLQAKAPANKEDKIVAAVNGNSPVEARVVGQPFCLRCDNLPSRRNHCPGQFAKQWATCCSGCGRGESKIAPATSTKAWGHYNPTEVRVQVKRHCFTTSPDFPEALFVKCARDALKSVCVEKDKKLRFKLSKEAAAQVLQVAVEAALGQFFC